MMSPMWAHDPISGSGAARTGGRWNRPGQVTLYAASELMTAVIEYWQEVDFRPGTFAALDIETDSIIDLRDIAAREALGMSEADLRSPWQKIWSMRKVDPPTWLGCDRARAGGATGLLVPSTRVAGGLNLVLWRATGDGSHIKVFDPRGEMPRPPANLP